MLEDNETVILEIGSYDQRNYRIEVLELGYRWTTRTTRITLQAAFAEAERLASEISEDVRVVHIEYSE